jgi:hypothetical protein
MITLRILKHDAECCYAVCRYDVCKCEKCCYAIGHSSVLMSIDMLICFMLIIINRYVIMLSVLIIVIVMLGGILILAVKGFMKQAGVRSVN